VEKGTFRQDLFYRLDVIRIRLPPLRERREDIPLLVDHFVRKFSAEHGRKVAGLDTEAMQALIAYHFPGNVRELENLVERAVILAPSDRLTLDAFPTLGGVSAAAPCLNHAPFVPETGLDLERVVEDFERSILISALERTGGNRTEAARLLGVSFRSLRYRLSKLGITGTDGSGEATDKTPPPADG
jgi:two-component system response regulator PilR (NtrC family)